MMLVWLKPDVTPATSCQTPPSFEQHCTWNGLLPLVQFTITTPAPDAIELLKAGATLVTRNDCPKPGRSRAQPRSTNEVRSQLKTPGLGMRPLSDRKSAV